MRLKAYLVIDENRTKSSDCVIDEIEFCIESMLLSETEWLVATHESVSVLERRLRGKLRENAGIQVHPVTKENMSELPTEAFDWVREQIQRDVPVSHGHY